MRQTKNTRHFVKRLEKNGYRYDRSNGSHRIYVNANGEIISVPTLIDAGGRFADGAVPEYMVFDKPDMGAEFVRVVEEGMERSKTELSKRPKATTPVKAVTTESTPTPTVQEEEVPFAEEDIDDIDTPGTEEVSSDYPEDLDGVIRAMFKECKDADLKAKVKAVIAEYGKLNDVDEDGLKKIYDMMK